MPPIRSERPVFDLRWINHDDVGALGAKAAWEARQEHDDHWLPLHRYSKDPTAEPTGSAQRTTAPTTTSGDHDPDGDR